MQDDAKIRTGLTRFSDVQRRCVSLDRKQGNRIKTVSAAGVGDADGAKSRFPKLLKVKKTG
jgi:hypothetical protein